LLEGALYDLALRCSEPPEVFGCVSADGCPQGETAALDQVGRCWFFQGSCTPEGFEEVLDEMEPSACSALMLSWPACPPQPDPPDAGDG
jgi:hypothetical protein